MKNNTINLLLAKFSWKHGVSRINSMVFSVIFLALIAGLDYFNEKHVRYARRSLEGLVVPVKICMHELIQIPQLMKGYLNIKRENETLKRELDILKINNIIANEAIQELDKLKNEMNIRYKPDQFGVIEKVLGFEKSIYSSDIIISKTHDITVEDAIVITPEGMVGIVSDVHQNSVKVLPITSSEISVPVKTNSDIHLIIGGTDKNEMITREIRNDTISALKIGDILYTSGEGGFYGKGIPVAKVTKVNSQKMEVIAIPMISMTKINYVWIIGSNK